MQFDLAVIGGGAGGFFGAIQAATMKPGLKVIILEKSSKLLAKVRISGGGRCNVTHHCFNPAQLARHYPRGEKPLKNLFKIFQASDVVEWFRNKGVTLKTEDDGRMFPLTDSSETIINCFLKEAERLKIEIEINSAVTTLQPMDGHFLLKTASGKEVNSSNVLIATGGHPNADAYSWIVSLGHTLLKPIPSLFTFNDSEEAFTDLMGISVPNAYVKIAGTRFVQTGPLLITHWGLSGPAIIKLSAWAAEQLHASNYQFTVLVSWIGPIAEEEIKKQLFEAKSMKGRQKIFQNPIFSLPQRLWQRLCELSSIEESKIWAEVPQRNLNKLMEHLIRCPFKIKGKTTFKEEFVTCGGIDLTEIESVTMESKILRNLYFAGEVLNIDGETGGFNFQSAWTTAYIAARAITGNVSR